MLIFRDRSVISISLKHQHPSHAKAVPQLPANCLIMVQGQATSVSKGRLNYSAGVRSHPGLTLEETAGRTIRRRKRVGRGGNSAAWAAPLAPAAVTSLSSAPSSGAGDMCEELWPPLPHPRGQPRFHRQRPGQNHLSQEQPSHHCPGQGASSDPGRVGSPCPVCWHGVRWEPLPVGPRAFPSFGGKNGGPLGLNLYLNYLFIYLNATRFLHSSHWNKNLSGSSKAS